MTFKVEGNKIKKWDTKYRRWNTCGLKMVDRSGEPYYLSFHDKLLYKWNALGVSEDILEYLDDLRFETIIFKVSKKPPHTYYRSNVRRHLESDLWMYPQNENERTMYVRINEMELLGRKTKKQGISDARDRVIKVQLGPKKLEHWFI